MSDPFTPDDPGFVTPAMDSPTAASAAIAYGTVDTSDTLGAYTSDASADDGLSVFDDYDVETEWQSDQYSWLLPVASPAGFNGQSAAVVQLAAPTLILVVDWTAERSNSIPIIPDQNSMPVGVVLLYAQYEPRMLELYGDSVTPRYRVSGRYVYGYLSPSDVPTDDIVWPRAPWLNATGMVRTMSRSLAKPDLIFPA